MANIILEFRFFAVVLRVGTCAGPSIVIVQYFLYLLQTFFLFSPSTYIKKDDRETKQTTNLWEYV